MQPLIDFSGPVFDEVDSPERSSENPNLSGSWKWMTVGELVANEPNAMTDGPFGSKLKTEHYQTYGPRVVRLQNIGDAVFNDAYAHISDEHFQDLQKHRVYEGDIVIAALGEVLPRSCIVPESLGPAIVKADCIRFKPKPEHSAKYLNYALNWEGTRKRTKEIVHGVGRPRLNLKEIKSILLPIAPPEEQPQIVEEIEAQLSRLEAGVSALKRAQANLKRYRAAVLKAACEGRLVPTEAELARAESRGYETGPQLLDHTLSTRLLTAPKAKGRKPASPILSDHSPLPEGWARASVDQVSAVIVDCPHSTAKFKPDGRPCIDTTCIKPGRIVEERVRFVDEATFKERTARLVPEEGDIIFAREGTVGTAVTVPPQYSLCLGQRVMLMRGDVCILPRYFQHCLNSEVIRSQYASRLVGSTVPHLNVAEVKLLAVPLPPLAEQERIVAEVEHRLSVVDEIDATITANLRRAARLRQSVLGRAFSGGIMRVL